MFLFYCLSVSVKSYIVSPDVVVDPATYPGELIPYLCKDLKMSDEAKQYSHIDDFCENGGVRTIDGFSSPYSKITTENNIVKKIEEIYIP